MVLNLKKNSYSRRDRIKTDLYNQRLLSASSLARKYHVSRQTIVGDIALLRAQGEPIIATVNGYHYQKSNDLYQGIIVCQHNLQQTRTELETIIAARSQVLDVVVDHPLYGQLIGTLGLTTSADIDRFMEQLAGDRARLLSSLTNGIHLHHLACPNEQTFMQIKKQLKQAGILYSDDET
ncbi:YrxA [Liquorilactobacillus ghanensis DSM 18630]|jgi:transcriptional regulator of NAD metabolism|uniref:YrxA n=1 Tax=Liquorilactobacillus ghanensis DSM 18630 TaxID=1423750 RepID=A0A0R1VXS6_9LACO|nr:YrxA [Liquorilactobacillus ghanensis DSM 18630]